MRIGIQVPQWGKIATRDGVVRFARSVESAGFDSLWVSDHIVHPIHGSARYPYQQSGAPFGPDDGYLEALTTLAVIAGATDRVRLGTSVLVLPMRETLLTAKVIATLDVLSKGRVVLVVAAGWWREEFEALGSDFVSRGDRLDEQLAALDELWTEGHGQMSGRHVTYPEVAVQPKPAQPGGPEVWIGGSGPRVWARIARSRAAGWHGIGHKAELFEAARVEIAKACAAAGRDPSSVRLSTATGMPSDPERAHQRVSELAEYGVSQVVFIVHEADPDAMVRTIERFSEKRPLNKE